MPKTAIEPKAAKSRPLPLWGLYFLLFVVLAVAIGLASSPLRPHHPINKANGINQTKAILQVAVSSPPSPEPPREDNATTHEHVFDQSVKGDILLLSKNNTDNELLGELWVRDVTGSERLVARDVTDAKLSPDGTKIAYATRDRELFIETSEGKHLAQIPRASDPKWGVDSKTVNFSAMADPDYPEMQQTTVYDLSTNRSDDPKGAN